VEQLQRVLLRELREQRAELLERCCTPEALARIDAEVDALGGAPGVGDTVGHRRRHDDVLEIGRARVEDQRQIAVVDGHLAERRGQRLEPERLRHSLVPHPAVFRVPEVGRRAAAQMTHKRELRDVRHYGLLIVD